jgi:hypothetical protein
MLGRIACLPLHQGHFVVRERAIDGLVDLCPGLDNFELTEKSLARAGNRNTFSRSSGP